MRIVPISRTTHDVVKSTAVNAASVVAAASDELHNLLNRSTEGAARMAGARYGDNAERATRAAGNLSVSTYKVVRAPQKFVTGVVVKGAVKAGRNGQEEERRYYVEESGQGTVGTHGRPQAQVGHGGANGYATHQPPTGSYAQHVAHHHAEYYPQPQTAHPSSHAQHGRPPPRPPGYPAARHARPRHHTHK